MPVENGRGWTQRLQREPQVPGGASRQQPAILAGVLNPDEERKVTAMRDRARIVHRHDATLTASNADPSPALCIKSPLQSHRAAACDALLSLFVSFLCACPVTNYETHDTAGMPLDRA